ncbi:GNAT family N-acetyltransferase [Deefgea rivuli]|uniref:GNAT family N-acetyltransferase n=1 Tax=Deefgea rivuli TaxID=400948 RepID=UPI000686F280|nr:GNAT family N-acetyltransferase [Deefgea rivuli]
MPVAQYPALKSNMTILIRHQTTNDIHAILAVQSLCYPANLIESAATLQRKQQLSPDTSWLIEIEGQVMGYLFCHPWHGETPPALKKELEQIPALTDRFYIHDLAIAPAGRGKKLAEQLLQHALNWARQAHFSQAMLVAVLGADAFWKKHQFTALTTSPSSSYGEDAVCMLRAL